MAKTEVYSSKKMMKAHEKGEGAKMRAMEKKMGMKDVVKKAAKKSVAKKTAKKGLFG